MNTVDIFEKDHVDGIHLLNQSIATFNGTALKFEQYYRDLEKRVRDLDLELNFKNRELKKNLREKEELKNYFQNILESLTTGIIVVDLDSKITTFNNAAENMTGLKFDEVEGEGIEIILRNELFLNLNHKTLEDLLLHGDVEIEISKRGRDVVHARLSNFPVLNPQGRKIGTALTLQDITQLRRLEEKASHTDRLAAMGEMAAEIAHEIRNPLGSIELFATTLKKDLEGFGELKILAEHISTGVRRMNNIISNLLLFVKPRQKPDFQIVDVTACLNETLCYLGDYIESDERRIEVFTEYSIEPLCIHGDTELLRQVFLNIIMNAVQAMPDGGKLIITAKRTTSDQKAGSNSVEIQFKDTGEGVSGADISKVFDPFYTTKKRGTGLGLAIVHNILKIHDGDIEMCSNNNEGAVCRIDLPLCKDTSGAV